MVGIEIFLVVWHRLVTLPRFWDHHHHGVGQATPRQYKELQAVIKFLGIGTILANDGQQLLQISTKDLAGQLHLACVQPVLIAADGVDLTIMAQIAEGLCTGPAGKGIGRKARVGQRQR